MKLYIESATRVSGTAEDFVYQLPMGLDLPHSLAYIDCVLVPNTIYSIRTGVNDRLYLRETYVSQSGGIPTVTYKTLTLPDGQFNGVTLATALQAALNAGTTMGANSYTVVYDVDKARLQVATTAPHTSNFSFYGDDTLPDVWNQLVPANLEITEPRSANKVCGVRGNIITGTAAAYLIMPDAISVQRHHVMYIHSDLGIPGASYGPRGETDIIRRVIIEAPPNALAIDRHSTAHDYVEVAPQPLRSIKFSLRGSDGKIVDLHGHEWSFSLIFHEKL